LLFGRNLKGYTALFSIYTLFDCTPFHGRCAVIKDFSDFAIRQPKYWHELQLSRIASKYNSVCLARCKLGCRDIRDMATNIDTTNWNVWAVLGWVNINHHIVWIVLDVSIGKNICLIVNNPAAVCMVRRVKSNYYIINSIWIIDNPIIPA
jgi:hypothetical protein